jgi:hypothetical protein
MGLSRRAYARQRGVAESAVRKAIAAGRIPVEPDGTIDPEKADAAWAARTNPALKRRPGRKPHAGSEASEAAPGASSYARVRTVGEALKAEERRIKLDVLKGKLVDRARAIATVFALARRERDAWLNWPPRVAALMAAELGIEPHAVETVLESYVRQHLAELWDVRVELR